MFPNICIERERHKVTGRYMRSYGIKPDHCEASSYVTFSVPSAQKKGGECLGAPWRKDAVEAKKGSSPR